jgi:hypothetical protein
MPQYLCGIFARGSGKRGISPGFKRTEILAVSFPGWPFWGSGGGFWKAACTSGAHVYVTGDLKYHDRLDALWHGLDLVVGDHGEMEEWSMKHLAMAVREMTGLETEVFPLPRRMFSA